MGKNQDYAECYAEEAPEQMRRYGIPASVILAQGILESGSGQSELCRSSNNHFGIKATDDRVRNGGGYLIYDDDRPNEKFCKYATAGDSFEHHSRFLKENSRYSACFTLSPDDYKGWTEGIASAGYATNGNYASSLQRIIEENDLQKYDRQVMQEPAAEGRALTLSNVGCTRQIEQAHLPSFARHLTLSNVGCTRQIEQAHLPSFARHFGVEENPRDEDSDNPAVSDGNAEQVHYSFPLHRDEFLFVTSPFGMRQDPLNASKQQMHKGIDIRASHDDVLATEDSGKVVNVNRNAGTAGGLSVTVEYNREDGTKYQCVYMHLSEIAVNEGDCVNAGQKLGVSGNTGTRTTGEHLHFGVRLISADGTARDIDPAAYLAEIAQKGNIALTALHNGNDLLEKYKTAETTVAANETFSPEDWMKKLLSSEDSGTGLSIGSDPIMDFVLGSFMSLMTLAMQIDGKDDDEQKAVVSDSVSSKKINLTSLVPGMKSCTLSVGVDGRFYLSADNGTVKINRELTSAEANRLSLILNNGNLTDEAKRMRIAGMITAITTSAQASQNFDRAMDEESQQQSMRR